MTVKDKVTGFTLSSANAETQAFWAGRPERFEAIVETAAKPAAKAPAKGRGKAQVDDQAQAAPEA